MYYDVIALEQGNQNPQNNMIASFSFTSTSNYYSMFKSFTSAGRDFDSTIKFNASTGREYILRMIWLAFDIEQV